MSLENKQERRAEWNIQDACRNREINTVFWAENIKGKFHFADIKGQGMRIGLDLSETGSDDGAVRNEHSDSLRTWTFLIRKDRIS